MRARVCLFYSPLTLHAALEELLKDIPTVCPLLGVPIAWTIEERGVQITHCPRSPSIDRIVHEKGCPPLRVHFSSVRVAE